MKHFVVEPIARIFRTRAQLIPQSTTIILLAISMTDKDTDETCESQLTIERAVPAKYVLDPRLLTNELEKLFGEGKFAVEVSQFQG